MNNIIVASFPRSGTHLTLNAINYNKTFEFLQMPPNGISSKMYCKEIHGNLIKNENKLYKIHYPSYRFNDKDIRNNKFVYICRDPKDVFTSLYFFWKAHRKISISEFVFANYPEHNQTIINAWKDHINSWFKKDILIITFESLLLNYFNIKNKLEKYLGMEIKNTIPALEEGFSVRKGIIGDHINLMNKKLIDMVDEDCKKEIKMIKKLEYE